MVDPNHIEIPFVSTWREGMNLCKRLTFTNKVEDFVEGYEIYVPFKALQSLGCKVDAISPSKKEGESCVTAIYDGEGTSKVSSEKRSHNFVLTVKWNDICVDNYDYVVVPGGRSPELLVMNDKVVALVKEFEEKNKVIAGIGQGICLLAAAGVLKDKTCASSYTMKAIVKVAGGESEEFTECVTHGKLVTAIGWSALPTFISQLSDILGLSVVF
ncbi:DJ-1 protein homolog E [Castanea sativa]|uniref:DJ-1 protein homolog E n=1 Tax=Castanea sativa TaxID=21020 RepID=UPI003F64F958